MNYDLFSDSASDAQDGEGLMAAIPFMPLYVAEYLADTPHLSTVEHGAYMLLIMTYWQRGEPLPADDKRLARIVRLSDAEWLSIRDEIADLFVVEGNVWKHRRIDHELEKAMTKLEQARNAGKASAQRRLNGRATDAQREFNHREGEGEEDKTSPNGDDPPPTPSTIVDAWQLLAERQGLPGIAKMTDKRKASLKARIEEHGIPAILKAIATIEDSDFLLGRNDRGWKANFDWLLQPSSMTKLIEGAYHGRTGKRSAWLR